MLRFDITYKERLPSNESKMIIISTWLFEFHREGVDNANKLIEALIRTGRPIVKVECIRFNRQDVTDNEYFRKAIKSNLNNGE